MNVKYRVTLTASERVQLVSLVLGGKGAFRRLKRAQILLAAERVRRTKRSRGTSRSARRRSTEPSNALSKRAWSGR